MTLLISKYELLLLNQTEVKMLKQIFCALGAFISLHVGAQSFNYKPLECKGDIPSDFGSNYFEKIDAQAKNIDPNLSKKERNKEMEFIQYNEFVIDNYLTSGKVLYGDAVTEYLNAVMDKVLENDVALRNEIRVYAVRSADFNAYTTNNGIIFVNLGLLAELETEAQLAYVLCHEVVHYLEKHVRETVALEEKLKSLRVQTSADEERILLKYYSFSKNNELEADELGYKNYFAKSGYSKLAPFELMDIMLYAYLPFDNITFDWKCLASANFGIVSSKSLNFEAEPITAREDVADSVSSHPNIKARRKELSEYANKVNKGDEFLIATKERFYELRNICRYECVEMYIRTRAYNRAIYQAFLLQQTFPDDPFLADAISYSLYAASAYLNINKRIDRLTNDKDLEGELSRVAFALKEISSIDLNTLAVCKSYENYKKNPQNSFAESIFKQSVWELITHRKKGLEDYFDSPLAAEGENGQPDSLVVETELNTGSKVKRLKEDAADAELHEENLYKYAFVPYLKDSLFTQTFKHYEDGVDKKREKKIASDYVEPNMKNEGGANIKKLFVVTPKFYTFNVKGGGNINFKKSTRLQENYIESITKTAEMNKLGVSLFEYKHLENSSDSSFNEMQKLQIWYDENLEHDGVPIVHYSYNLVKPITEAYNTHYLMFSGVLTLATSGTKTTTAKFYGKGILSILFLPAAPFLLASSYIPTYEALQYTHVVDLRTGADIMSQTNEMRYYRTDAVLNNILYDQMLQLSAKPKFKVTK